MLNRVETFLPNLFEIVQICDKLKLGVCSHPLLLHHCCLIEKAGRKSTLRTRIFGSQEHHKNCLNISSYVIRASFVLISQTIVFTYHWYVKFEDCCQIRRQQRRQSVNSPIACEMADQNSQHGQRGQYGEPRCSTFRNQAKKKYDRSIA